jgi:hypothetical protein
MTPAESYYLLSHPYLLNIYIRITANIVCYIVIIKMMKVLRSLLVLLAILLAENLALDAENYTAFIEERSQDANFVNEYTKWSLKLLSQPDYIYGMSHGNFTCSINKSNDNNTIPTSVHTLRPSDIKCIGAMGDSFTTGLAMRGTTLIELSVEDRGEMITNIILILSIVF